MPRKRDQVLPRNKLAGFVQILLGVVFGIWGISLALPLMAIAKVLIDHFKAGEAATGAVAA